MLGQQDRWQGDLFVVGSLRALIPADHILRRVDAVLDLGWLRDEVADCYCDDNGRPSIDPEAAVRLMLAGFLVGIVHDRKLMREAQVNLAIRWLSGYKLHETLPDHSSLTRIRQRWGADRFRSIFRRTVGACVEAGLVAGEIVHLDATLIRANVSWDSLAVRHVEAVNEANREDTADELNTPKRVSSTDPDASLATSDRRVQAQPSVMSHKKLIRTVSVQGLYLATLGESKWALFERSHLSISQQRNDRTWKPSSPHAACRTAW